MADDRYTNHAHNALGDNTRICHRTHTTADESDDVWQLPAPTERQTQAAIDAGIKALGDKELLEENTASPAVNTPSFRHQRAVSTTLAARVLAKRGYVENQATMQYMRE